MCHNRQIEGKYLLSQTFDFKVCHYQEDLQYFISTSESCIGPHGSLKMVVSCTGNMMTTSSSSRLWKLIQVEHILAEFILQSTNHLPDHRLQSSSLAARIISDNTQTINLDRLEVFIKI